MDISPSKQQIEDIVFQISHKNATLVRVTDAFCTLIDSSDFSRQELVNARYDMLEASEALSPDIAQYKTFGLDLNFPIFVQACKLKANCEGLYQKIFDLHFNKLSSEPIPDSEHKNLINLPEGVFSPNNDLSAMHGLVCSTVPSGIPLKPNDKSPTNIDFETRELERLQRSRARKLLLEKIKLAEKRLILRQQELADEEQAEADALLLRQLGKDTHLSNVHAVFDSTSTDSSVEIARVENQHHLPSGITLDSVPEIEGHLEHSPQSNREPHTVGLGTGNSLHPGDPAETDRATKLNPLGVKVSELQAQLQLKENQLALAVKRCADLECRLADVPDSSHTNCANSPLSENSFMAVWVLQNMQGESKFNFNGNPLDYPEFLHTYNRYAILLKNQPDMCLQMLRSLLSDLPLKLVTPYLTTKDPSSGLEEALSMLKLAYGSEVKLSRAKLKSLLNRPPIQSTELGLLEFYSELNSCLVVLKDCNRLEELDTEHTLKTLFNKLPDTLQDKWADTLYSNPDSLVNATYANLMELIREEHRRKTSILNQWLEEEANANEDVIESNSIPTMPSSIPTIPSIQACLCTDGSSHSCLLDCPIYNTVQTVDERWRLLVGRGACFRCLEFGHKARDCSFKSCGVMGCDEKHHPSLHFVPP